MKRNWKMVIGLVGALALAVATFGQVERMTALDQAGASVTHGGAVHGHYTVECIGADGALKWRDTVLEYNTIAAHVEYQWAANDGLVAGVSTQMRFQATMANGKPETFPKGSWIDVVVNA